MFFRGILTYMFLTSHLVKEMGKLKFFEFEGYYVKKTRIFTSKYF